MFRPVKVGVVMAGGKLGVVEVVMVVVGVLEVEVEVAGVVVPEVEELELGVVGELEVVYLDIPGQPYNLSLNLIQTCTHGGIAIDLK